MGLGHLKGKRSPKQGLHYETPYCIAGGSPQNFQTNPRQRPQQPGAAGAGESAWLASITRDRQISPETSSKVSQSNTHPQVMVPSVGVASSHVGASRWKPIVCLDSPAWHSRSLSSLKPHTRMLHRASTIWISFSIYSTPTVLWRNNKAYFIGLFIGTN